ncbi:phosphotransferase [Arthrobacter sp. S41]|uniref:phosphotransferase n=2 Tax=Micrococcaceae TaxID=1268 RepID=UPI001035770C|nr:phosphotransferase [Arthrobacter sp. S41]TAP27708.1 aminoglycoside phosphotransferase [Arthrobacter sp. S41]
MKRSAMELAAIATAAVPGLAPVGFAALSDDAEDFDSALIVDAAKHRWRVRSPKHDEASMRLEAELSALRAFSAKVRTSLPFALPSVAGTVRQGTLRTFVYKDMPGRVPTLDELVDKGSNLAKALGQCMAAIHQIPDEAVEVAGLPTYTADEIRQRKLNELDTAAATGKVPSGLLRRWEHAMEDVALWRFNSAVVHGAFDEEQLQISHSSITAVKGWTDLHVGDPADDFAWLSAIEDQSFTDRVFSSYMEARGKAADPHIMRRAALAAEFALAQWLVKSLDSKDPERIAEADEMLRELDHNIAEFGGQPLSVVEAPRPLAAEPAAEVAKPALQVQDSSTEEESVPAPVAINDTTTPRINTSKVSALSDSEDQATTSQPTGLAKPAAEGTGAGVAASKPAVESSAKDTDKSESESVSKESKPEEDQESKDSGVAPRVSKLEPVEEEEEPELPDDAKK